MSAAPRVLRRRVLEQWTKRDLIAWYRRLPGLLYTAEPLSRWNKTDLIASILDIEHPRTPAPDVSTPVEQADGHPDPLLSGPGEPELSERAAGALLDFMVDDLQMRGVQ